jgi:hypothetical protein
MVEMRKPKLTGRMQDKLNHLMEEHYPDIIGNWSLVDAWKHEGGYDDWPITLFGVYQSGVHYRLCSFPDHGTPLMQSVTPKFEHTGWQASVQREAEE